MTRDEAEALLPFLANGTLEGSDRQQVEAAVAADPELRNELGVLRTIRDTMQNEKVITPGDIGLARLLRDVDAVDRAPVAANSPQAPSRFWQIAAVLLLAVVLGQTLLIGRDVPLNTAPTGSGGYTLAGDSAPIFTVAFRAGTTEEDMRNLLLDAGVEVTSGPSALGLYGLNTVEGVTKDDAQSILSASIIIDDLQVAND